MPHLEPLSTQIVSCACPGTIAADLRPSLRMGMCVNTCATVSWRLAAECTHECSMLHIRST